MTQFKLEEHEINSPLWQKLKTHYEAKLAALRAANDNDCPDDATKRRRGRIQEIKNILSAGIPEQAEEE
jgi:hypothetical protein